MLKKYKWLIAIVILAFFLRVYKLSEFPVGFHADEVRAGWNAYSILKTGKDDWGHSLPLHYNTFGDFRPTGYFYSVIPSLLVFGVNEFAVRFPSALFGTLTIVSVYFLVHGLKNPTKDSHVVPFNSVPTIAALLLTLSPWHIALSRATSEGIVAIFFAITGLVFLVRGIKTQSKVSLGISFALLLLSYFFYHSARLLVPFLALTTTFYFWKIKVLQRSSTLKLPVILCITLFLSTILFSLNPAARGRFNQVSIFSDLDVQYELAKMPFEEGPGHVFEARLFHNKVSVYTRRFINEYTQYMNAKFFLVPKEAKPLRYSTVGMGVLTYVEFALLVAGLVALAQKKSYTSSFILLLLLLAPLPAALTTEDAPNMHRALFMVPFLSIIKAFGVFYLVGLKSKVKLLPHVTFLLLTINFIFFYHMYFVHNRVSNPLYRNVGATELAKRLAELAPQYPQILVTNIPDSPFPWVAFFAKADPAAFNTAASIRDKGVWSYNNMVFTSQRCPSRDIFAKDAPQGKILVVDADACESEAHYGPEVTIREQVRRPDNTVVYTLWSRE